MTKLSNQLHTFEPYKTIEIMKTYTLTDLAKQSILKVNFLELEVRNMNDQDFFLYAVDFLKMSWDK